MSSIEFGDLGTMGPPGLKDVMKMIALRRAMDDSSEGMQQHLLSLIYIFHEK